MFTIDDIKPLVKVEGATAVLVREHHGYELDAEIKAEFAKMVKKATKLPVIFVPYGVDVRVTTEDFSHDYD